MASAWQFFSYWVADFEASTVRYRAFGRITDEHIVGRWYDRSDRKGYYGAFELEIVDAKCLRGRWLGHSKDSREIRTGAWRWTKSE